jgi:hypothetical protein
MNYSGCRVNTLSIKGEIGSPIIMSAELVGQKGTITTSVPALAAFSTIAPLDYGMASITTGNTITSLSAVTCVGFELTINNNFTTDANARKLGSKRIVKPFPGRREVNLKLTQRLDTTTAYSAAIANTATAINIAIVSPTYVTVSTTSGTTYGMHIKLPQAYVNTPGLPEIGDAGVVMLETEWNCIYSSATGYSIQMLVDNATASYG